jgi:ActR/RegA family two-component response regulator
MTGYAEIETAVEVLKIGASDYLVKPLTAAAIQGQPARCSKAVLFTEFESATASQGKLRVWRHAKQNT